MRERIHAPIVANAIREADKQDCSSLVDWNLELSFKCKKNLLFSKKNSERTPIIAE